MADIRQRKSLQIKLFLTNYAHFFPSYAKIIERRDFIETGERSQGSVMGGNKMKRGKDKVKINILKVPRDFKLLKELEKRYNFE